MSTEEQFLTFDYSPDSSYDNNYMFTTVMSIEVFEETFHKLQEYIDSAMCPCAVIIAIQLQSLGHKIGLQLRSVNKATISVFFNNMERWFESYNPD